MSQSNLNIETRRISEEEQEFNSEIQRRKDEITECQNAIKEKIRRLRNRKNHQQRYGLEPGEKPVTEKLIQELIKPIKDRIKVLEREIISLNPKATKVTKAAKKQTSMF